MKKPTIIIGKKQIIMTCLTLILGIAVYVNYVTSPTSLKADKGVKTEISDEKMNYGETEFVNAGLNDNNADIAQLGGTDYFAQARLDKMTNRDEAVQTLQSMIGGGDVANDEMVTNALAAVEVSKLIESEGKIESLIKAQGFADCVAYLDGESAKVVVKTEGLDKAQAASIKEVILDEARVSAENIRIFEVK